MTRIDPGLKERWCTALESGKYKQGQSVLRTHNNLFCCLGVLVDIERPGAWIRPLGGDEGYGVIGGRSEDAAFPPADICQGLSDPLTQGSSLSIQSHLADMNDDGADFHEITGWIRENL